MESINSIPRADETLQSEYTDGHVGLRRFRPEDAASLHTAARESIKELSTWMTWCHADYSIEESAAFVAACEAGWESGGHYCFVIFSPASGEFLGSLALNNLNRAHGFANLGYWVRRSRTGRALPPAVRLGAQFAFEELGLHRVEIVIPTRNRPSRRAAENAGARLEGVLRNRLVLHGELHDAAMYSLVAEKPHAPEVRLQIVD